MRFSPYQSTDVMTTPDPTFDDPQLKAAVNRVWGTETAPAYLRERVAALGIGAARVPAADVVMPGPLRRRAAWTWPLRHPRPLYGLAAAAMMVIGFGIAYQLDRPSGSRFVSPSYTVSDPWPAAPPPRTAPTPRATTSPVVLPAKVAEQLFETHARCVSHGDHDGFDDVSRADFDALRQRLERQLGYRVLAGPVDDGRGRWEFRGGAVCTVGDVRAAHLVFVRNGQAVSVFTLPKSVCPDARGGEVAEDPNPAHPLAVYVRPNGVQCIVGTSGDGSLFPQQLRLIAESLRPFQNQ